MVAQKTDFSTFSISIFKPLSAPFPGHYHDRKRTILSFIGKMHNNYSKSNNNRQGNKRKNTLRLPQELQDKVDALGECIFISQVVEWERINNKLNT